MTTEQRLQRLAELRVAIFDIANSLAGPETGNVAVQLHSAANILSWSKDQLESYQTTGSLPASSLDRMLVAVNLTKQMQRIDYTDKGLEIPMQLVDADAFAEILLRQ